MKKAYIQKDFRYDKLQLIETVDDIITDYQQQGYKLTLRQVYYQLVSRDVVPNTENSYKAIGELLNDARLAGLLDWSAIEDRTRNLKGYAHWSSPAERIRQASYGYLRDHWEGQPNRPEVWVEKEALAGIIQRAAGSCDVDWFCCRGYVSQSEMWNAAQRFIKYTEEGQQPIIIYLGDHDPSGLDMTRDIRDRLTMFEADVVVERIALNMDQVREYNPPPNPAKITDSRAGAYIETYGRESWELDALKPDMMDRLIRNAVEEYRTDADAYEKAMKREQADIELLREVAKPDNWAAIAETYGLLEYGEEDDIDET
jgi:hypothetical protein